MGANPLILIEEINSQALELVGTSRAGKTTIVNLPLWLYYPTGGMSRTDDWPIEDIRRTDWLFRQRPRHNAKRHIVVTTRWHVEGDRDVTARLKDSMSALSSPEQVESDTVDLKSWSGFGARSKGIIFAAAAVVAMVGWLYLLALGLWATALWLIF